MIVAIDGPAGAGKSTVARRLADLLGYVYIDTGAMYRAVALAALRRGVPVDDPSALETLMETIDLAFKPEQNGQTLLLDGEPVEAYLRTAEVSQASSLVSRWPEVRERLVELQRRVGQSGGVVMEGRDIGAVVFPQAELKIFLTASPGERARRRLAELRARGEEMDLTEVARAVETRDRQDEERAASPLRRAPDAVELITDGMTLDDVVGRMAELARERGAA